LKKFDAEHERILNTERLETDLVVVGGGLAGTCCAITAARAGVKVVLIQDRPVLGGSASSEVRLWILGATSHMGNNNRWAREGGVVDEILVENLYRNPEGNSLILDTILLEKVVEEESITLLLNTAVHDVVKNDADTIESVRAFCSQNSTEYRVTAPLFCDASGDGIVGFLAGAAFRTGAESRDEFGELFAPEQSYGELLGHSLYFYTKDTGKPVEFVAPSFALKDVTEIPRWRAFNAREHGCQLWWIEYGGRLDTVHQTEEIKWELWKVVYGVWDHVKNSGQFPEAETLTLEWVGTIPGKRESRRFEGDYMLIQQDIVEQREHADAVSYGGWAMDLHPADGVYSELSPCTQWHSKGVYQIPYRCMYSRNIANLFLAGRIISASHVAFGSTRVMATCAHNAQAVGMAAALCTRGRLRPRDLLQQDHMTRLQCELYRAGQYIPQLEISDPSDQAPEASITASSQLALSQLLPSQASVTLDCPRAMLVPLQPGTVPRISLWLRCTTDTELVARLRTSRHPGGFTPDELLAEVSIPLGSVTPAVARVVRSASVGTNTGLGDEVSATIESEEWSEVAIDFGVELDTAKYAMVTLEANPDVEVALTDVRLTGVLSLSHRMNGAVAKGATQKPPEGIGIDTFEFWLPERRPGGKSMALRFDPPLEGFEPEKTLAGPKRPTTTTNAWIADFADEEPSLDLAWDEPRQVDRVVVSLDADFDHPMESVLLGHPERELPLCAKAVRAFDESGNLLSEVVDNHQAQVTLPIRQTIRHLHLEFEPRDPTVPVSVFRVSAF
jgi:hypothetical protein